jgi:thioredoxin-like negative regulator of GroEL
MTPIVDGLKAEFAGQAAVIRLNAEAAAELMNDYGGRGHPTFVVLDGKGDVTQRFTGPQPEETLREAVVAALADG